MFDTLNPHLRLLAEKEQEEAMLQQILKTAHDHQFCIVVNHSRPYARFTPPIKADELTRAKAAHKAVLLFEQCLPLFRCGMTAGKKAVMDRVLEAV